MTRSLATRAASVLAGVVLAGATGVLVLSGGARTSIQAAGPVPQPAPQAVAAVSHSTDDTVPWDRPLTITVSDGELTSVTVLRPDGTLLPGTLTPAQWTSDTTLVPRWTYHVQVALTNDDGKASTYTRTIRASAPSRELRATITPTAGVYGVGQPVVMRFNKPVKDRIAREAVLQRLSVTTTPPVVGAWHWFNSTEVHYRAQRHWAPGTAITVRADLAGLQVPGTAMWGVEKVAKGGFTIGDARVSTVDLTAHTMTVTRNGKVERVMKISAGRKEYPTRGGTYIVLKREKEHLFNSATIGIPTASPGGYYLTLPWAVRISNSGTFVHAQPGTIRYQGRANVSHGCVNASPWDAKWFHDTSRLGDVVRVVNAAVGPLRSDAGMADWNYSWETWQQGNLGN